MKKSISKLKKKLDAIFSKYIRLKNADSNGYNYCFTCNKFDHYKNLQNGHFISRKYLSTRFDEQNCAPQCPKCNIFCFGEQYLFGQKLGKDLAESLQEKSRFTVKIFPHEYEEQITYYQKCVDKFLKDISKTDYF